MIDSTDVVKSTILRAFAATPYPGDDNLVTNSTNQDPESQEIAEAFRGKQWNTISAKTLHEFAQALPLFTPEAFRYYLPAYMLESISLPESEDILKDVVPFNLMPPSDRNAPDGTFFMERAAQFTVQEREAIASYLSLVMQVKACEWRGAQMQSEIARLREAIDFWRPPTCT